MSEVKFQDFTVTVKETISKNINSALEECAGELEAQVKRNSRVKTGKTKNSFKHYVNDSEHFAVVGSSDENAIWEEFGTGEYALNGNGRKGGWSYTDEVTGKRYFTTGKKPSRAFYNAYKSLKNKIIKRIQDSLKGL